MDVILKVTKGSKIGTKIAVKKEEFLIGRSPECHLCAGSTSISRQHCAIHRTANHVTVKDLGSRNGTLVNGKKTEGEVELSSGDTLTIGTLEFLVTMSTGISNEKKPQVKTVAEAVERSAEKSSGSEVKADDISRWLLEADDSAHEEALATDTQTIRLDDTKASELRAAIRELREESGDKIDPNAETLDVPDESPADQSDTSKGKKKKKEPGKLPPVPHKPATKDSREAAAEALRSWSRRR